MMTLNDCCSTKDIRFYYKIEKMLMKIMEGSQRTVVKLKQVGGGEISYMLFKGYKYLTPEALILIRCSVKI